MILNKDIGFVRAGQPAVIKVEAFPFTRYGTIDGTVAKISPDAVDLRNAPNLSEAAAAVRPQSGGSSSSGSGQGGPELAFPATITPTRRSIAIDGQDVNSVARHERHGGDQDRHPAHHQLSALPAGRGDFPGGA